MSVSNYFNRRELRAQMGCEITIEFDGDQAVRARSKNLRNGPRAGPDFNDGLARYVAQRVGNGDACGGIDQKVLPQFWFLFQSSSQTRTA